MQTEKKRLTLADLPFYLQEQVKADVKFIENFNATILRLRGLERKLGDKGRYEAEYMEKITDDLQKALSRLESFLSKATELGYEGKDVLGELSYQIPISFSQEALEYFGKK